ncbi:MAG TPA: hypothetical protein PK648_04010, partial [Verrucomicrobiales bacterium]|nr:hypothetical protein [Verrucomicrobiales bacterium]
MEGLSAKRVIGIDLATGEGVQRRWTGSVPFFGHLTDSYCGGAPSAKRKADSGLNPRHYHLKGEREKSRLGKWPKFSSQVWSS